MLRSIFVKLTLLAAVPVLLGAADARAALPPAPGLNTVLADFNTYLNGTFIPMQVAARPYMTAMKAAMPLRPTMEPKMSTVMMPYIKNLTQTNAFADVKATIIQPPPPPALVHPLW